MILLLLPACAADRPDSDPTANEDSSPPDTSETGNIDTGPVDGEWARVAGAPADGLGNALAPAGDPDGDGRPDLLAAAYLGNRVCVLPPDLPTGETGLDDVALACMSGETETDYAGYGIAGAGDADADGVDDLLVASIGNREAGANAGKVYLVRGPVTPGDLALADAGTSWLGEASGDYAGTGLAAAGDVTADGSADLVIGASGYDDGGVAGGRVYVVPGPVEPGAYLLGDAYASITGLGASSGGPAPPPHGAFGVGDFLGDAVLGPGDLDGDGVDDLALGASGDATQGAGTGKVAVFRGPIVSTAYSVADADLTISGAAGGSYTGSPIAAAGDVTGDGTADLWISADALGAGHVYLFASASQDGTMPVAAAYADLTGAEDGDYFGFALSAGDADGDGVGDLLVGAPYSEASGPLTGSAYLFRGPFASSSLTPDDADGFHGATNCGTFGSAVAVGPDLDLDGSVDLVVGEYTSDAGGGFSGALYLFHP